ncbi:hypothetical protein DSBG_2604 [Desulfosporosinus sp. BG]|nr:hypothetical protein DSBG_2604 [Desulfosporosinus sp. BG]
MLVIIWLFVSKFLSRNGKVSNIVMALLLVYCGVSLFL